MRKLSQQVDTNEPKPVFSNVRPKMEIGISVYNPEPSDEDLKYLSESFIGKGCKCDACGASLNEDMVNHHFEQGLWFNVCSMCYCASNLDKIPHYVRGEVIWFPYFSQARLNAIVRGLWAGSAFQESMTKDIELKEMIDSLDDITELLNSRQGSTENFFHFTGVDTVSSTLFILRKDEYDRRSNFFSDFRWLPVKEIFEDEMAYWAPEDYSDMHPEKISSNITKFMSKYSPEFSIKK